MAPLPPLPANFAIGLELIDQAHAQDPTLILTHAADGTDIHVPYELHYARETTRWLASRCPGAPATLQLACRAQHFQRWQLPRSAYPMTRPGYLSWRARQKSEAASRVAELLASGPVQPALAADEIGRVAALIRKENLRDDGETQVLEDVACLVFLDHRLDDFEQKDEMDEDKILTILRKTWVKMSAPGRDLALAMPLSERGKLLLAKALKE